MRLQCKTRLHCLGSSHIHIHTYIHTCSRTYTQTCTYIHTYIYTCTYIHIYIYVKKDYYFLQIRASAVASNSISSTNNKTPSDKLKTARPKRQEALSKLREMKISCKEN